VPIHPPISVPGKVFIAEVGPRDGLQMEQQVVPTDLKLALIEGLADAGLSSIQVAAFVHPEKMPQMADAEALIARLPVRKNLHYSALTLNLKGVERACRTSIPWIEVSLAANDAQSLRNAGMSMRQALDESAAMTAMALRNDRSVQASIQCAFGCSCPTDTEVGQVRQIAATLVGQGISLLMLADTTGLATPRSVVDLLEQVLPVTDKVPVGLHLHDTRGLGLVNLMTALQMGIVHFDTALGGLGGCPFVSGAAGNIATEDTLHLLHSLHIETGIDAARVAQWSRRLSDFFGHPLPGRMYRL